MDEGNPTDPTQLVTTATVVVTAVAGAAVLTIIAVARKYGYLGGASTTTSQASSGASSLASTPSVIPKTPQPSADDALKALTSASVELRAVLARLSKEDAD